MFCGDHYETEISDKIRFLARNSEVQKFSVLTLVCKSSFQKNLCDRKISHTSVHIISQNLRQAGKTNKTVYIRRKTKIGKKPTDRGR